MDNLWSILCCSVCFNSRPIGPVCHRNGPISLNLMMVRNISNAWNHVYVIPALVKHFNLQYWSFHNCLFFFSIVKEISKFFSVCFINLSFQSTIVFFLYFPFKKAVLICSFTNEVCSVGHAKANIDISLSAVKFVMFLKNLTVIN